MRQTLQTVHLGSGEMNTSEPKALAKIQDDLRALQRYLHDRVSIKEPS